MPGPFVEPPEVVVGNPDRRTFGFSPQPRFRGRDRVIPEAGRRQVERDVEMGLKIAEADVLSWPPQCLGSPSLLE